jgi:undecaprenyl-diphosphooligosaccharide---protein glycotransferase
MNEARQHVWVPLFLASAATAYLLALALRLMELPLWSDTAFIIHGEPLMATHDAYGWMAGAKGTGTLTGRPMSLILKFGHSLTGLSLSTLGFWLPAIVAPLVVFPLALAFSWWNRPEAGITAGVIGGGAFGYLFRTRLGYGDTDILILVLLVTLAVSLVGLLTPYMSNRNGNPLDNRSLLQFWFRSTGVGVLAWILQWFYPNAAMIVFLSILLGYATAFWKAENHRSSLLGSLGIIVGLWLGGPFGLMVPFVAIVVIQFRPKLMPLPILSIVLLLLAILSGLANGTLAVLFSQGVAKFLTYSRIQTVRGQDIPLPIRFLSVREAQMVDWLKLMTRVGIHWLIFLSGIAGYAILVRRHLSAIIFLPLLLLSIFSFKLGNRFTMFGCPVIGIGFGFLISDILYRASRRKSLHWAVQIAAALLVFSLLFQTTSRLQPTPVLPNVYAETFAELRNTTSKNARLWQWWDYGYAAQYYAERQTMDDGGQQKGMFPLALVHTTSFPLQANQMIKFCTVTERAQIEEMVRNGTNPINPGARILYYPTDPMLTLKEMGDAGKAQAFVADLARKPLSWPDDLPPQYLVFSWENLKLAYWISYFGTWDLVEGRGNPGQIQPLKGKMQIDLENGKLVNDGKETPLAGVSLISEKSTNSRTWHAADGLYLVVNSLSNEAYLMDRTIYDSMMVRMLIGDPEEFSAYFELVEDGYPWVRAYLAK